MLFRNVRDLASNLSHLLVKNVIFYQKFEVCSKKNFEQNKCDIYGHNSLKF